MIRVAWKMLLAIALVWLVSRATDVQRLVADGELRTRRRREAGRREQRQADSGWARQQPEQRGGRPQHHLSPPDMPRALHLP